MNEPRPLLQKLMSRKLLVALLAIVASLQQPNMSITHTIVLGAVAVAYIVCEAFIDRAGREQVFGELLGGVVDGTKLGKDALDEDDDAPPQPHFFAPTDPPARSPIAKGMRVRTSPTRVGTVDAMTTEDEIVWARVLWDGETRADLVDPAVLQPE